MLKRHLGALRVSGSSCKFTDEFPSSPRHEGLSIPLRFQEHVLNSLLFRIKTLFFFFQNVSSKECITFKTNLAFSASHTFCLAGCYKHKVFKPRSFFPDFIASSSSLLSLFLIKGVNSFLSNDISNTCRYAI